MTYKFRDKQARTRTSVVHPIRRIFEPVRLRQQVSDDEVAALELDDAEVVALHALLGAIITLRRKELAEQKLNGARAATTTTPAAPPPKE